jgi:hypothetical protein
MIWLKYSQAYFVLLFGWGCSSFSVVEPRLATAEKHLSQDLLMHIQCSNTSIALDDASCMAEEKEYGCVS